MTSDEFIDLLQRRQLVPEKTARQLRAKAAQGDQRITPKSILKYLVKKEIVSRSQAKELLETTLVVSNKTESSILGLAPLADLPEPHAAKPVSRPVAPTTPQEPRTAADRAPAAPAPAPPEAGPDDEEPVLLDPIASASALDFGQGGGFDPFSEEAERDPLAGEDATPVAGGRTRKGKKGKRSTAERKKNEWDSPLLLLGGAGLAVLLVAGVVLYWLLTRENADLLLTEANEAFESGSYTQAIPKYERFITNHTGHQEYSQAKVRYYMAQLWRDTERTNDYAKALQTAERVISEIEDEPAFEAGEDEGDRYSQAKGELSSLLTTIATGLAEQADAAEDPQLVAERVEQINQVLALTANTKYVPQGLRRNTELDAVRETLDRVLQRQQREKDLAAGLAAMDQAIAKGDTAAAFDARRKLVKQYPVLRESQELEDKVLKIAEAEQALVKFVEERKTATTEPAASAVVAELAMADRHGETTDLQGATVVRIDGALYGVNLADGSLLWRRFIGMNGEARPLLLSTGNVVSADSQGGELVCLDAQTGELIWRLPLEGALATPASLGERLLIASDAGRLYLVEQASGELLGHVTFNQPLRLPPTVSEGGDRIYVLGEHSNLYTLSSSDLACVGVRYIGHAAGEIAVPPALVLNKLIIADNSGLETSRIRMFTLNADGAADQEVGTRRLAGLVLTPLQTAGRRVAAVTSRGQAAVFEASTENDETALSLLAARDAQRDQPLAHFALFHDGHLWIAGNQLNKLAVQPTGNQLTVRSIERDYRGDAFDYPLQAAGETLIHLRRPAGKAGARLAASDSEGQPLWEVELATPPAGAPSVDASGLTITAGAASGAVYLLDREAMTRRVQNEAVQLDSLPAKLPPMTDSAALTEGRLVLGGRGAKYVLHYRPGDPRQPLRAVELAGPLSCAPISWRGGFATATDVGQVTLHSAEDGSPVATPFQPELKPGREYHWLRPAVVGEGDDSRLVISDGVERIYVVGLNAQPQPHLAATASVNVGGSPLVSPLAVVGSQVLAGNAAGQLARFTLPELKPSEPIDLGGRVTWGPHTSGQGALLATDGGELLLVSAEGAVAWRRPLEHGQLGGVPLVDGGTALVLSRDGGIARINLADGSEQAFAELGQSAVAGPVAFGPRLVVSGADGTILVINRP
ncbi:MAG TPA: PQQ-binding-like beta-propeller repeat protein [Lacipirellula sp.]